MVREVIANELPKTKRLPIITSHTGFTFASLNDFIEKKRFKSVTSSEAGLPISKIEPENRKIGRTNDLINKGLFANPWSINLFDEEIIEIMQSKGMIGISLDQRILGVSNPGIDSIRDKYFEPEYIAYPEWEKLFRDGKMPGAEEGLAFTEKRALPSRPERHMMLLSLHLIHAVRIGYASLNWLEGTSPWDHLCIGSDFDGLINPINGIDDITQLDNLREELKQYLIQADKYLVFNSDLKALQYNEEGKVNEQYLNEVIEKFMFINGLNFIARYLTNWNEGI